MYPCRDAYIQRLHGIYHSNLSKDKVVELVCNMNLVTTDILQSGTAKFDKEHTVNVDGKTYTANHILIATGLVIFVFA